MILGHFGVAFALKKYDQSLSLGFLFIAVQVPDFLFATFILLGIEHARIVPGFTEASSLDLYDFPFSHSLLGTLILAIATYFIFRYGFLKSSSKIEAEKTRTSLLMGIGVFSHYILDFIVHPPDLLIIPGVDLKIGLGLWNFYLGTIILEIAFLLGGFLIYNKVTTSGNDITSKYGTPLFIVVLILGTLALNTPNPLPGIDIRGTVILMVLLYLVVSGGAFWLDRTRNPNRTRAEYI